MLKEEGRGKGKVKVFRVKGTGEAGRAGRGEKVGALLRFVVRASGLLGSWEWRKDVWIVRVVAEEARRRRRVLREDLRREKRVRGGGNSEFRIRNSE